MSPFTERDEVDMMSAFEERLNLVRGRIASALASSGRNPADVLLVAVSKGHGTSAIRAAYQIGIRDFGESYVQELQKKRDELRDLNDIRWHFVGHLQSNKVKFVYDGLASLHSLDRKSLLDVMERTRGREATSLEPLPVLVEMEVDPTDSGKTGATIEVAHELCDSLKKCRTLVLAGFMGMGPAGRSNGELRLMYGKFVEQAHELWRQYSQSPERRPVISLGMSDDLEVAIASGSTLVRVGTALFGSRVI